MIIIKISLGDDVRRIAGVNLLDHKTLRTLIGNLFSQLSEVDSFTIKYKDEEDELCVISGDLELQEAFRQVPNSTPKVLRLYIYCDKHHEQSQKTPIMRETLSDNLSLTSDLDFSFTKIPKEEKEPSNNNSAASAEKEEIYKEDYLANAEEKIIEVSAQATNLETTNDSMSSATTDLSVLESIEKKLQQAFQAVSQFMDSLAIDTKFFDAVESVQQNLKRASEKVEEHLLQPLAQLTKSKAADFQYEMEKLHEELKRLKALLKEEISKLPDTISNLTNSEKQNPSEHQSEGSEKELQELPTNIVEEAAPTNEEELPSNAALEDLQRLADMGFVNKKRNLELLSKYPGDLVAVVEALLSQPQI